MRKTPSAQDLSLPQSTHPGVDNTGANAATVRPTDAQRRYLERGLAEPGGKLPLFDRTGREVPHKTIHACIAHGWAEPWVVNPIKPEWLVCRLTPEGVRVLNLGSGHAPKSPDTDPEGR
jgi:hypothetical protein